MALGKPKGLSDIVEDLTPQLGGDLDSNSFDVMMGSTDEIQLGDTAGGDGQIVWDGTDLEVNVISGNVEFNLPGAHASRTSQVIIQGNASQGDFVGPPFFEIISTLSNGNAYVMRITVAGSRKFSIDNEGDLFCGSSVQAGALTLAGSFDPVWFLTSADNGQAFGATHQASGRHKILMGLGSLIAHTANANVDQADVTLRRKSNLTDTYTEAGTVVRIVREMTNTAAGENGDYLQFSDNTPTIDLAVDKTGTWQFYTANAGLTYGGIYVKDSSATVTVDSDLADTLITHWTTNTDSNNCTPDQANDKITITKTGHYLVTFSASVSLDSGATVALRMEGYLNGVVQANLHASRTVSSTDVGSMSFSSFLDVTSAPLDLDIRANINSSTARLLTVEDGQLNILQVGGT
jgi:hypothetical protein